MTTPSSHYPHFPAVTLPHLNDVPLPPVQRLRLPQPRGEPLADLDAAVDAALERSRRINALSPGAEIAVAVGSRGIVDIDLVVAAAVAWLKRRGLKPFIVPAMGSHGGATAAGQIDVLKRLGVTEERVGAPLRATMDVVELGDVKLGDTADSIPCCFDANAAAADAVLAIARVKSHTSFDRPIESGLCKLLAVGLGKARGARNVHVLGPRGLSEVLPALAAKIVERAPVGYGLALVEDAGKRLVHLEGVEPEDFHTADERLLVRAKALLARLPFERIDALIVEQIGKDISGAGMDYAVTARTDIRGIPNPPRPLIGRVGVLGLTAKSGGNGVGLGTADFTTRAVIDGVDLLQTYTNAIVSAITEKVRIPIVLSNDRDVLRACLATCWRADPENARLCVIRSTLFRDEVLASPALASELVDGVEVVDATPEPLRFDADGALLTRV